MKKNLKILIVGGDCWNDSTNGNNIYSNWFIDFDAEFANIYIGQGFPQNTVCKRYFQVTDKMILRSIYSTRAGNSFILNTDKKSSQTVANVELFDVEWNKKLKSLAGPGMRLLRELMWCLGRYDKKALKMFIDDFNPDIIFCTHFYSLQYGGLVRTVRSLSNAPMVGFTGDAQASLENYSLNPFFWIKQLILYFTYPSYIKLFKQYFSFSRSQCEDITRTFGVPAEPLYKCIPANQQTEFFAKQPNNVLKLVYAGRLYCNRWKTLSAIGDALKELNKDDKKAELFVYSQDILTIEQKAALSEDKSIHFMGPIHPSELPQIYRKADIALHVESFDKKNRLDTKHSLSTKIIDLMSSSCAILAICWDKNNGWNYLRDNDAAICLSDNHQILPMLRKITVNPRIICEYAYKAYVCGVKNHSQEKIHNQIKQTFTYVINQSK